MTNIHAIKCLGKTFASEDERRDYFRNELRKKLPELKKIEGFPIGEDEDIIALSDPPYYTACPNPWLNDFIAEWEMEKESIPGRKKNFKVDEPYASDVSEGKNNPIYNAHSYPTKVPHPAIMRYILHYTQPGDILLDGFAGTGMTGVACSVCKNPDSEARYVIENEWKQMFDCLPDWGERKCINNDLSPLASHISSIYNNGNIIDDYDAVESAIKRLEENLSWLYETKVNGKTKKINYSVWSSVITCENCNSLSNYFDIAYSHKNLSGFKRLENVKCPSCKNIRQSRALPMFFTTYFDTFSRTTERVAQVKLSLVNYYENKSKRLKIASQEDDRLIEKVKSELQNITIPCVLNPGGVNLDQPVKSHGYRYLHQFYPDRTLIVISAFLQLTSKIKSNIPLFILTSTLPKLTKLNRYMPEHGGRALVGPRANTLYIPPLFVENNAIEQIKYQFEKIAKAIKVNGRQVIQTSSASQVYLKDNCIDYVFTDPPFGGNIMYSELNLLSETWIRVATNNRSEAITNDAQSKGVIDYERLMVKCFEEYYRVLKPGKWITVEFSNTSAAIWNAIQFALRKAGFLIVSVDILDKQRPGFVGMIGTTAVKEDLAITCLKPIKNYHNEFTSFDKTEIIWEVTAELLSHSQVIEVRDNSSLPIVSRDPRVLWDRIVSFFLINGFSVPIDLNEYQAGLRQKFIERDGMFFTVEQAAEYDEKKSKAPSFIQLSLLITTENEGIEWLKIELRKPQTYQDIQPKWMQAIQAIRKGDIMPELKSILSENFIQEADGRWRVPDMNEAKDREALRTKALLKEFDRYIAELSTSKTKKLKEVRVEALRAGFKSCWEKKDFNTIVTMGDKIPQNLLLEDEQLLMFYDIAKDRI